MDTNTKPIDEFNRQIRYKYGVHSYVSTKRLPERECEVVHGILEGPPEETPDGTPGEMETAQMMAQ
jgi:creatinine amidohydrolase